jgi:undecaprenyl-diphosphatase
MFSFERGLTDAIFRFSSQAVFLKPLFAFCGEVLPYILFLFFVIRLFMVKSLKLRYYYFFLASLAVIISRGIVTEVIRFLFEVSRPFVELGFDPLINHAATPSFPSGHMAFLIPLTIVVAKMNRRAGWQFGALTLLVGISRVFSGVHWISDILGGIAVGVFAFWAAKNLLPKKLSEEDI